MDYGRMRHNAFLHDSDEQYAERALEFVSDGLEGGDAVIVAGTRDRLAVVREALGPDAAGVSLVDAGSLYTRPVRTIAAYYGALVDQLRSAPGARVLAEVQFGPTQAEWDEWAIYEAVGNRAFAGLPVWLLCTYDESRLSDHVIESAWQTHPEILRDDWHASPDFEDPARLVRALTSAPEPLPELRSLAPGDDVNALRERLAAEAAAAGVPEGKALELLLAATEVASNAWRHGGGPSELRVGRVDGRFVCEICDHGPGFDDPLAGYIPPGAGETARGLWIARQLTWRLEHFPSADGFAVRLWL